MEQYYNFHMQLKITRDLFVVHGYKTLATSVSWVTLPIDFDIKQLDDYDGTEATYHAGKHKTWHLKFNQTKLQ